MFLCCHGDCCVSMSIPYHLVSSHSVAMGGIGSLFCSCSLTNLTSKHETRFCPLARFCIRYSWVSADYCGCHAKKRDGIGHLWNALSRNAFLLFWLRMCVSGRYISEGDCRQRATSLLSAKGQTGVPSTGGGRYAWPRALHIPGRKDIIAAFARSVGHFLLVADKPADG